MSSVTELKLPWFGLSRKTKCEVSALAAEQSVLTPGDCAAVLGLGEDIITDLLESGQMPGLLVAGQWRLTPDDLQLFLAARRKATELAQLERKLWDSEAWANEYWKHPEEARRILEADYPEGTLGRFLRDALRDWPPS